MAQDNWADRKGKMRCSGCMWWVRKGNTEVGRCRRHAPGQNGGPGWPPTFSSDWCGDHRISEDTAPSPMPVPQTEAPR